MRLLTFGLMVSSIVSAQPARPRISGIAHIAISVSDLDKARAYYKDFLGFSEPFSLKNADGSVSLAFIKVNDYQYIEVSPGLKPGDDRMKHIALYTDDAERLRVYLASRGVAVPESVPKGRSGNLNFNIKDPDGHTVEILQYLPDGWAMQNKGKSMTDARISKRIPHIGILVGDAKASVHFYGDILGFQETYRGSSTKTVLSWINMRVPDGDDFLEFMLYKDLPAPDQRGSTHHLCLEVPTIASALETLQSRPYAKTYSRPFDTVVGFNRKRHMNVFDPDGTRAELMEPVTVDGKPPESSSAPPPR
jgi:catechol 2,3-dioxygenase-like lactoylglutathione lyase family enzyme